MSSRCSRTGRIPSTIGNLTTLIELSLGGNKLSGELAKVVHIMYYPGTTNKAYILNVKSFGMIALWSVAATG